LNRFAVSYFLIEYSIHFPTDLSVGSFIFGEFLLTEQDQFY